MRCWIYKTPLHIVILAILTMFAMCSEAVAARPNPRWNTSAKLGQPIYDLKVFERLSVDTPLIKMDIAFEVMNDVLLFVREDTVFKASIEVDLSIFNKDKNRVYRDVEQFVKTVSAFDRTNSFTDFLTGIFTTDLKPGKHKIVMILTDQESRRQEKVEKKINLLPFKPDAISLSSIILTRSNVKNQPDELPHDISIGGHLSNRTSKVYAYYEVYRPDPLETTKITLTILDKNGLVFSTDSLLIVGGSKVTSNFIQVPISSLGYGEYNVRLVAESAKQKAVRETGLFVNFHGLPGSIIDLDRAIDQLRYITTSEEMKALKKKPPNRKERALVEFWDRNFPTPGEIVNGKMREYYRRVDYSNRHFGSTCAGWQTDRGHVLIIYGEPTNIERNQQDSEGLPYEIWYYDHLSRQFVFKDEYGFGEYRLTTPIW